MRKALFACGILAPLVYTASVIIGGLITPNYSHVQHAISELFDAGAPAKEVLDPWFLLYNGLLVSFGLGLQLASRKQGVKRLAVGAYSLVLSGLLGILMNMYFPMDPRGAEPTFAGLIHLILAGAMSLLTVLSVALSGLGFGEIAMAKPLRRYSLLTAGIIMLTGVLAAASAAGGSSIMGLLERMTIGAFLQWLLVAAVHLVRRDFAEPSGAPANV